MRNCSIGALLHLKKENAAKVRFNVFFGLAGDLHLEIKLEPNSHFICLLGKLCYFHNFLICFSLKKSGWTLYVILTGLNIQCCWQH